MGQAKYLWLDLETTGLDPKRSSVLEAAYIVTDADLVELGRGSRVFYWDGRVDHLDKVVQEMHTANGLFDECRHARFNVGALECLLDEASVLFDWAGKPILAGSSVHFDRSFIEAWAGDICSHRHLDVTAIKLLLGISWPDSGHRAMSDVESSLEQARRIKASIEDGEPSYIENPAEPARDIPSFETEAGVGHPAELVLGRRAEPETTSFEDLAHGREGSDQ